MFGLKKSVKTDEKTDERKQDHHQQKDKEIDPKDIAIELRADLTGQKKEEYDLAIELGLGRQAEIIKLESFGFKSIRRADCYRLLGISLEGGKDVSLSAFSLSTYGAKIPFGLMCRIKEIKEKNIFDRLYVVAPEKKSTIDPLLIGEKFASFDTRKLPYQQDYWDSSHSWYPPELGYRRNNFWERNSIVMLIGQWE